MELIAKRKHGKFRVRPQENPGLGETITYRGIIMTRQEFQTRCPEYVTQITQDGKPTGLYRVDAEAIFADVTREKEAAIAEEQRIAEMRAAEDAEIERRVAERRAAEEAKRLKFMEKVAKAEGRVERAKIALGKEFKHAGAWPEDITEGYGTLEAIQGEYTTHYRLSGPGIEQICAASYGGYGGPVEAKWTYRGTTITHSDFWSMPDGVSKGEILDMKLFLKYIKAQRSLKRAKEALDKLRGVGRMMSCMHCNARVPLSGICNSCGEDQY